MGLERRFPPGCRLLGGRHGQLWPRLPFLLVPSANDAGKCRAEGEIR